MIAIDKVLISDEIVEERFVCDLDKCKGGCCEDGEAGAPLEKSELAIISKYYETVKPYLTQDGISAIQQQGTHVYDQEFGWVTPTIKGKMCAYGYKDAKGIIKCGIEQAYNDKKIDWKKPISCHLYPIRVTKTRNNELLNYEPRESLCNPACVLGRKLKVPAYVFLKESLIRKYGEEFYNVLSQVAKDYYDRKNNKAVKDSVSSKNKSTGEI